jgi:hypothetical protein
MPDISMCVETNCPLKYDCYRHADSGTKPSPFQTYSVFQYIDGKCKDFMESFRRKPLKSREQNEKET